MSNSSRRDKQCPYIVYRPPRVAPTAPSPSWPRPDGRLRVGFAGGCYLSHGGTESWHQLLFAQWRRSTRVQVVGYAVRSGDGDPNALAGAALAIGDGAIRSLARSVDVLVAWGIEDLGELVPRGVPRRPRVVLVNHTTSQMAWGRAILERASTAADALVGVAGPALEDLPPAALAVPHRRVIYNAVDPDRVRPGRTRDQVRAEWGVRPDEVAVLSLSRLSTEKRVPLLADAVEALGPRYRLVVAGDGPERRRLDGRPRVVVLGRREDVGDQLAAADLVAAASEFEGFGLSLVEAMTAHVPVVSTPVGILVDRPELARLVPIVAGPGAWAEAIALDWADAGGRMMRAARAASFARANLAPARFAREWEELVLSLVAAPTPRPRPTPSVAPTISAKAPKDVQAARLAVCRSGAGLSANQTTDGHCAAYRPARDGCQHCKCAATLAERVASPVGTCPLGRWP